MVNRTFFHIVIFLTLTTIDSHGQIGFEYNDSIEVIRSGGSLKTPWAGGLDYPQFSSLDFDYDGDLDLFIFDRSNDNIRVFLNETVMGQTQWKFLYNAAAYFPTDLIYRATIVDFDNDGKGDLFTYSIGGLKVYRNVGDAINGIEWELFKEIIYSDYNGFNSNLYVSSSDIPAIVDVDFDGDIDILTFQQGGQHVEYHKNLSMENYGTPDSLEFVLANECWGKFTENANNNAVQLNDTNFPCSGGTIPNPESPQQNDNTKHTVHGDTKSDNARHAGSTILALDYDNSGVLDLILGDVAYENLVLLINGGASPNTDSPMTSFDASFPSNSLPASVYLFPAPFYVDVDFDGIKDLIVCPNAKNVSENEKSILFYKNIGSNNNPTFIYQQNNFLQDQMIEHGKGSIPVLYDVDGDGLNDLLVSNFFRLKNNTTTKESTIAWYKNTGTNTTPIYTFIDYNWLNLNAQNYGTRLVPTFGDIDNDGQKELILGREDGTLILYENNGSTFISPTINYRDNTNTIIDVGNYSFPQLFDLNNDGLLDLIIGNRTGKLSYYQNIGTSTAPSFQLVNDNLGNIEIIDESNPDSYTAPHFFRQNGELKLFLGAIDGKLHYYNDIETNLIPGTSFNIVSHNFLNIDVEAYSSFWVEDINNNSLLNMFVGQDLGGLYHFEVNPAVNVSLETQENLFDLRVFPNPMNDIVSIESSKNGTLSVSIFSSMGSLLNTATFQKKLNIDTSSFQKGVYLFQITDERGNSMTQKVVKQ